jgi:hypothetical protein
MPFRLGFPEIFILMLLCGGLAAIAVMLFILLTRLMRKPPK